MMATPHTPPHPVKDAIETFLRADAAQGDARLGELLCCALLKPLFMELADRDRTANHRNFETLPVGALGPRMRADIAHVADWIRGAVADGAVWLRDLDDQGRPRKLLKIGSLAQAIGEADKAMRIAAQKAAARDYADEGNLRTVKTFENGYRIVQLLTPEALDQESGYLGHCVGNGGYDALLKSGRHRYYSLRDPNGRGHATLEVETASRTLLQCKGKQNNPPVAKYMPMLQAFILERQFRLGESPRMTGLIALNGQVYDINSLPRNLHVEGRLMLRGANILQLPEGLHVGGSLDLTDASLAQLPENLHVGGSLVLVGTAISQLPDSLHVGGSLVLAGTNVTQLPDGLRVGGKLDLWGTKISQLPDHLHVGGDLALWGTRISRLPEGLRIGGNLTLSSATVTQLPADLRVGGSVALGGTRIAPLPGRLRVCGLPDRRHWLEAVRTSLRRLNPFPKPGREAGPPRPENHKHAAAEI
jgi:hypothetical protein